MSRNVFRLTAVLAVLILPALLAAGTALAAKGGNPGPPVIETASNNLSVPTIMISGTNPFTNVTPGADSASPSVLQSPSGDPLTGFELPGLYYVQGESVWQAQSYWADSATGTAEWGDNLGGDASLKAGSPIRVELGLFDSTGVILQGFSVVKLEPSKLDRDSAYGTQAVTDDEGATYHAVPVTFPSATDKVRIFDPGVTFSVQNLGSGTYLVPTGTNPTAEINATGKIVYGYNLRVSEPGVFRIMFTIPSVTITGVDVGSYAVDGSTGFSSVWIDITVVAGGGKGH